MRRLGIRLTAAAGIVMLAATATIAATDSDKCAASKSKAAGKYAACRMNAKAKSLASGDPVDYLSCSDKFDAGWNKAEDKYLANCLDDTMTSEVNALVEEQTMKLDGVIAGTTCPGVEVGGYCWVLGAPSASCWEACAAVDLDYDVATGSYAGNTGGSTSGCSTVMTALGLSPMLIPNIGGPPDPIGCAFSGTTIYWTTDYATDGNGVYPGFQRACACE